MRRNITFIRNLGGGDDVNPVWDDVPDGCAINTSTHPRWTANATYYGTNNFLFNALPNGGRLNTGAFISIGDMALWWVSNNYAADSTNYLYLIYSDNSIVTSLINKKTGFSVICCRNYAGTLKDGQILENAYQDGDGNYYDGVRIGSLMWITKNLYTTKYQNGTDITNVTDNSAWSNLTTGAYCYYSNDFSTYGQYYGALYNWYAVNNGLVTGNWRVPSNSDFSNLYNHIIDNYDDITSTNVSRYLKSCRQVNHPLG